MASMRLLALPTLLSFSISCPGACVTPWCGCLVKLVDSGPKLFQQVIRHLLFAENRLLDHGLTDLRMVGVHVAIECLLPGNDLINGRVVQIAVGGGIDEHNLFLDRYRLVLWLLENFGQTLSTVDTCLGGFIKVGGELREGSQLTELG